MADKKENVHVEEKLQDDIEECFVIMPISDPEGYNKGHFKMIYDDIFTPAIEKAGFKAYRADDNNASDIIQIKIVEKIIKSPMAICDLSNRNPNVLFELGMRQAFNKPVVLVQEEGEGKIFDVQSINTISYKKECIYRDVIDNQDKIAKALRETYDNYKSGKSLNSLVSLMDVEPAKVSNNKMNDNDMLKILFNEIMDLKNSVDNMNMKNEELTIDSINNKKMPMCVVRAHCKGIIIIDFGSFFDTKTINLFQRRLLKMMPSKDIKIMEVLRVPDLSRIQLEVEGRYTQKGMRSTIRHSVSSICDEFGIDINKLNISFVLD